MSIRGLVALLAASCLAAAGAVAAAEVSARDQDMVWLKSLERLRGEVVSLDARQLVWRNADFSAPLTFPVSSLIRMRFGPRPAVPPRPANPCVVRLINQDELAGSLVGMDGAELQLDTWYAGTLHIPRWGVASLQPVVTNPKAVYQGPNSLEEWTQGNAAVPGVQSNAWVYADGTLLATAAGSVAKDVKMPPQASIDMDLDWSGLLGLSIALYADSLQPIQLLTKDEAPDFGGFYSLQLNSYGANVMLIKKGVPLALGNQSYIPNLNGKTSAHLAIRTQRSQHMVYVYLDGALIKQWQDPNAGVGAGTCLRIVNQSQGGVLLVNMGMGEPRPSQLRISNLVVSEWDGRQELPAGPVVTTGTNDVVQLLNRDALGGTVQEIRDGQVKLAAATGPLTIPLERVAQAHFAPIPGRGIPAVPQAARAFFHRRGRLLLRPEGWEADKLVATHPLFGRMTLDLAAFRLLEWTE